MACETGGRFEEAEESSLPGDETLPEGREMENASAVPAEAMGATGALSDSEIERMKDALLAVWAVPFVDDIEDFIWEAIFCYTKGVPISDPLIASRSKLLYDVVDAVTARGWSIKALQVSNLTAGKSFEFVIQRADIFAKAEELGFQAGLSIDSAPDMLGEAVVEHWNRKVRSDTIKQQVKHGFLGILLKSRNRRNYAVIQEPIPTFYASDYHWEWTGEKQRGLQAKRKEDNRVALKWYAGQKHLFQCLTIPDHAARVEIVPERAELSPFVALMLNLIGSRPGNAQAP